MAVDITNHLIPYAQVKRMLEQAWDEGRDATFAYRDALDDWAEYVTDHRPERPNNPYREDT